MKWGFSTNQHSARLSPRMLPRAQDRAFGSEPTTISTTSKENRRRLAGREGQGLSPVLGAAERVRLLKGQNFPLTCAGRLRLLASEETCLIFAYCSKGNPGPVYGDAVHFRDADQQCQIRFGAADPW